MKYFTQKPRLLVGCAAALVVSFSASAVTFRDIDHPGILLDASGTQTYHGVFDLITGDVTGGVHEGPFTIGAPYPLSIQGTYSEISGFDPNTMQATSGKVSFWIKDNDTSAADGTEIYTIALDDIANKLATGSNFGKYKFQVSGLSVDLLMTINETGALDYYVTATEGNFILDYAMLDVQAQAKSVPDAGATLTLLGLGVIGMTSLRRLYRK